MDRKRHYHEEEYADIKGVIIIRKSKDSQRNGQKDKHDQQNTTQKTKDRLTRTPLTP